MASVPAMATKATTAMAATPLLPRSPPPSPPTALPPPPNVSICHPVFFTDRLRKPLFAVSAASLSPVAHGYVYRDALHRPEGTPSKL